MKNIKISNKFVELLKKGVSIGLVVSTVATFTACSDSNYTTGNIESTTSAAQLTETNDEKKYTVEELDEVELWDVRDFNGKIVPMIIKVDYTYYMGFGVHKCCCEIKDFETDNTLVSNSEYYDFIDNKNEIRENVRNRDIEDFRQQYGSVEHNSSVYISLVEKFGQKPEYSLTEIMSIREDRVKELANKKEETTCKQEVTTEPNTKVVEQAEKTTVPSTTIPANATIDNVARLRSYGQYMYNTKINDKIYRIYSNKNGTSQVLVNEKTFKEVIPFERYSKILHASTSGRYIVGLTKDGDVDKIYIDQNEKITVNTILEDANYRNGVVMDLQLTFEDGSSREVPYLFAWHDSKQETYALINLNTNVVECEADVYTSIVTVSNYSLGIKKNGDVDKIMHNKEKAEIINVARNTGYDTIAYLGFDEYKLFNNGVGIENGRVYTLVDDELVLAENVKKKTK